MLKNFLEKSNKLSAKFAIIVVCLLSATILIFAGSSVSTKVSEAFGASGATVQASASDSKTHKITFVYNKSLCSISEETVTVESGSLASVPQITMLDPDYVFSRFWCLQTAGEYDLKKNVITSDLTILVLLQKSQEKIDRDSQYKITFDGNGHRYGEMADQSRKLGDKGALPTNEYTHNSGENYCGFRWWEGPDGKKYRDGYQGDISGIVDGKVTLKAIWSKSLNQDYWIAPASKITTGNTAESANQTNPHYSHPYNDVVKTHEEIQIDITALKRYELGDRSSSVVATYNEYKSFMENDDYHLYTRYSSSYIDGSSEYYPNGDRYTLNDFAEFRIVQLGAHYATGDGKGNDNNTGKYSDHSAITFQLIHALPVAKDMFRGSASRHSDNSWTDAYLNTQSLDNSRGNGGLYKLFTTLMTSAPNLPTSKWVAKGRYDGYMSKTYNKLWIMSLSELAGTQNYSNGQSSNCADLASREGEQYDFWKRIGVKANQSNPALVALGQMRDGTNVKATNQPKWIVSNSGGTTTSSSYSWTRTFARNVDYNNPYYFNIIDNSGNTVNALDTSTYASVTPCFAWSSHLDYE